MNNNHLSRFASLSHDYAAASAAPVAQRHGKPATQHWLEKTMAAAAVVLSAFAVTPAADAAPIHYQESVSGDLAELGPLKTMNFDIGANTVSGSQSFDARNGIAADFDQFKFVVPAGTKLVGISMAVNFTDTIGQLTLPLYLDVFVDTLPQITVAAHEQVNLKDPSNPIAGSFQATLPIQAGNYLFFEGQVGSLYSGQAAFWDYTWTFDVAAVPEPGSVALVGAALAAMAAARRRRTAAQQAAV